MGGGTAGRRFDKEKARKGLFRKKTDKEVEQIPYPNCRGSFDDCPNPEDFDKAVSEDKSNPSDRCKRCPIFKDSKFYKQKIDPERLELWKRMMSKE